MEHQEQKLKTTVGDGIVLTLVFLICALAAVSIFFLAARYQGKMQAEQEPTATEQPDSN